MTSEARIALAVLLGGAALVIGVQQLPPLTAWEPPAGSRTPAEPDWLDGASSEYAYCEERLEGLDCGCFAGMAREVLSTERTRFAGWTYADKMELAVTQARDACR